MTNDTDSTTKDTKPTDESKPTPADDHRSSESETDRERPSRRVQSSTAAVDPTSDSGIGLALERRHVIASTLAAVGLAGANTAQARHENNGQGNGNGQGHGGGNGQGQGQSDIDVKTGHVSHESPGAADDGSWNTSEVDQQSVEFEESFEAPPVVFIGAADYTTIGMFRAIEVTEDGFESRWMVYQSESFAPPDAQWVAVGQS
ncbi:hypothetical protein [Natronorubrum daqingense]|uniref:Uncharacterized protein n=1 Tax=Natronorubrum daqingense TaxID=588898 RepID=A0A1N7EPR5_9EURY|nr:hypothetical protein [Natronorubrum daqingense]APX97820.1 hypothetical protein BB347_15005 [Natronorubrum daqingense]SIR89935.1 hypothetical protein SAMN05421809_2752 [Natronorubrum daqingense]